MAPKRFIFRLETVLKVKLQVEEDAKRKFGELVQLLAREQARLVYLENELVKTSEVQRKQLKEPPPGGIPPQELQRVQYWKEKLKKDIIQQRIVIKEVEARLEQARIELVEAMKERKILETLKEQQLEAFNKEMDEEEAKLIDELATLKYARDAGHKDED